MAKKPSVNKKRPTVSARATGAKQRLSRKKSVAKPLKPVAKKPATAVRKRKSLARTCEGLLADSNELGVFVEILERMTDGFMALDRRWRITYVNAAAEKTNGMTRESLLGRIFWEAFPAVLGTEFERQLRRAMAERVPIQCESFYEPYGRWFEMDIHPIRKGSLSFYGRDITDRKQSEEMARLVNERLNLAVRASDIGTFELDLPDGTFPHGRVVFTNVWEQLGYGRPASPTDFNAGINLAHPDDRARQEEAFRAFLSGESPQLEFEVRLRHRNGGYRWMLVRGVAVYNSSGKPIHVIGSRIDITDRKHSEEQLRQSEEQLADAQELAHVGSWNWDLGTDLLTWSDEHYRICGLERREGPMTFERGISVIHPDDLPRARRTLDEALRDGNPYECSLRLLRADGSIRFVHSRGRAAYDAAGSPVRMYGTIQDVTERVRAEEAVRVANERLDLAMRASNIGVWDVDLAPDSDYRVDPVRFVNVWEQLGYELAEFPTDACASRALGHPDDLARVDSAVAACLAGETQEIRVENRIRHKDGSYHWLLTLGTVVRDMSGRPVRLIGTVLDITERKRADERIRRSEALLTAAEHLANVGSWSWDINTGQLQWSDELYRIFGLDPRKQSPTHESFISGLHPADRERVSDLIGATCCGDATYDCEFRITRPDGRVRTVHSRGDVIRDAAGSPIEMIGMSQDITDRMLAEEKLRASEERFREMAETVPGILFTTQADGTTDYVSQRFYEYTGLSPGSVLGDGWQAAIHPDDLRGNLKRWRAFLEQGAPYDFKFRLRSAHGGYRWFLSRSRPVRDNQGSIVRWMGAAHDIDDLVQTEEAMRRSEERYRGTFENAAVGITHRDAEDRFLTVNKSFCDIVGYSREELLGMRHQDIIHPDDVFEEAEFYERLYHGQLPNYSHEERLIRKDGGSVWTQITASLQRDTAGNPSYVIALVQDISERKWLEEELSRAKEVAESANHAKDEFLANVSHEIRTPFGAILGMTELVLDTPLSDEQRQDLAIVRSETERLLMLVNDLLDYSKIESRKVELDSADFALRDLISEIAHVALSQAQPKGLELATQINPSVPNFVVGDSAKLRMVLLNLLINAVKFTKVGEVTLRVEFVENLVAQNKVRLRFAVIDTGIGIPQEKQSSIFSAFEQADNSATRRYGGTGLGLTIANELAILMGGTIRVESEPGVGSIFTFEIIFDLPTASSSTQEPVPAILTLGPPLRVLVAEDDEFNAQYVDHLLTRRGHSVRMAKNGREALGELELSPLRPAQSQITDTRQKLHTFDLLLVDLHMPEIDGFEVIRSIRNWERELGGHLPIIALTARSRVEDRERCLAEGADEFLSKPVRMTQLVAAIETVVSRWRGACSK